MKITFIRPSMTPGISRDALEPLAFGVASALTPEDIDRRLYDERIEPVPLEEPTDLVALSVDTYSASRAYELATHYRERNVPVVLGGFHPTLAPQEAMRFGTVVTGDLEDTWPTLLEDARRGSLKPIYRSQFPEMSGMQPDRTIFTGKKYGRARLVQFTRGCTHRCDFCSIHAFYRSSVRTFPIESVVKEVAGLDPWAIVFADDNFFANERAALELMRRLKDLKIRWACQASIEIASRPEVLRLMEESCCFCVMIGFESLSESNLGQMRKSWGQKNGKYQDLVPKLHERGIMVYGSFVFGYDNDNVDTFDRSLEFAVDNKLFLANFNLLTPMPGTELYRRLQSEGRLTRDPWWLDLSYRYGDAVFTPVGMTADELTEGCYRIRTEFNRMSNIAFRSLNSQANMRSLQNALVYWGGNFINRHEIHRKQGARLGVENR